MARKNTVAGTEKDPNIQFAKLKLNGQEYKLAYSFNAIAEAESIAGCNLLAGLENLSSLSALQLRGLLYAGLAVANLKPRISLEEAGAMIRLDTIGPITSALAEAYVLSMPEKKDPPEAEDAPAEETSSS
jgi:hypothetical protein